MDHEHSRHPFVVGAVEDGEDAVRTAVTEAIAELGATDPKMAGRVVGAVMKKHKGVVEASLVKKLVSEQLG